MHHAVQGRAGLTLCDALLDACCEALIALGTLCVDGLLSLETAVGHEILDAGTGLDGSNPQLC